MGIRLCVSSMESKFTFSFCPLQPTGASRPIANEYCYLLHYYNHDHAAVPLALLIIKTLLFPKTSMHHLFTILLYHTSSLTCTAVICRSMYINNSELQRELYRVQV